MMPSRGMGAVKSSKMPKAKTITRKDDPNEVTMFAEGGEVEKTFKPIDSDFNLKFGDAEGSKREVSGRLSAKKKLSKDLELEGYIDGYAAKPKGMSATGGITGGGISLTKRFAKGGESKVNEAGNYTKPSMRKRLFEQIKAGGKGGAPGQWSARKAQMLASQYKKSGGGYK